MLCWNALQLRLTISIIIVVGKLTEPLVKPYFIQLSLARTLAAVMILVMILARRSIMCWLPANLLVGMVRI